jgi:hypothetical protein
MELLQFPNLVQTVDAELFLKFRGSMANPGLQVTSTEVVWLVSVVFVTAFEIFKRGQVTTAKHKKIDKQYFRLQLKLISTVLF